MVMVHSVFSPFVIIPKKTASRRPGGTEEKREGSFRGFATRRLILSHTIHLDKCRDEEFLLDWLRTQQC